MSSRVLQSPLLKNVKDKLVERKEKIMSVSLKRQSSAPKPAGRDAQLLTKEELPLLFDNVKTLILHLRSRIAMEKNSLSNGMIKQEEYDKRTRMFDTDKESSNPLKVLGDARIIRTVAETGHKNLLNALNKFSIPNIASVVRLVFQSADVPLIKAEICAEIFFIQDNASKNKTAIDIDDLRACLGKAPARNIDILGQLIALLAVDTVPASKLAYSWGLLIFLPRFDHKNAAAKEYESFDLMRQTTMVISVTKLMIEQSAEVFGLNDDDAIQRMAKEIRDMQSMELNSAAAEAMKMIKPPPKEETKAPKHANKNFIGRCRVAYQFDAEGQLEISVAEGEELFIIEKGADEWWKVRTDDGREGLVPENFVEEIPFDSNNDENVDVEQEQTDEDVQQEEKEEYYDHPEPEEQEPVFEDEPAVHEQEQQNFNNYAQQQRLKPVNVPIPVRLPPFRQPVILPARKQEDFDTSVISVQDETKQDDEEVPEPDVEDEIAQLQRRLSELQNKKGGRPQSLEKSSASVVATPPAPPPKAKPMSIPIKPQPQQQQEQPPSPASARPPAPSLPSRGFQLPPPKPSPQQQQQQPRPAIQSTGGKQAVPPPPLPLRKGSVSHAPAAVATNSPMKKPVVASPAPASAGGGKVKPMMDLNAVLLARQAKLQEMSQ